jgi:transposase-like protein
VIAKAWQSGRTKALSVVLHALGLSFDNVSRVLAGLKVGVVKATVWNNVQEAGQEIEAQRRSQPKGKVSVIGVDETIFKVAGQEVTVGFVTDAETGEIIGIDILTGRKGEDFVQWLSEYVRQYGVEVLVSDDLESYGVAAEELGLKHQLCIAHVRKSVRRRLREIKGHEEAKEQIISSLKSLDAGGKQGLWEVFQKYKHARPPGKGQTASAEYRLRLLSQDLLDEWHKITLFQKRTEKVDAILGERKLPYKVPSTNNVTERAIARAGKIRYKTMRGLKAKPGVIPLLLLIAALSPLTSNHLELHC